jgi:spermidine/putrescine transport system substrate-binding protein
MNRRAFLRLAGAGLALATMPIAAGCGRANERRLRFLNWQDYIDPDILRSFEAANDVTVSYTTYASNDELADRLNLSGVTRRRGRSSDTADLIVPSDNLARRLLDQDRLQRLDDGVVTAALLEQLDPEVADTGIDPGNRFTVPWASGTTGIGYDRTVFDEVPDWSVFSDPAFAGRITLLDERREAFAVALHRLGKDPNTTAAADVDAAAAELEAMKAVAGFDSATYLEGLASGRLVAAHAFSTDVLQAAAQNPNLAFVVPESGGTRWVDLLCIPEDAPNPGLANRFIAHYLDPAVSARNIIANRADTGNVAARDLVDADLLDNPAIFPTDEVAQRLTYLRDLGDDEALYVDAWAELRG